MRIESRQVETFLRKPPGTVRAVVLYGNDDGLIGERAAVLARFGAPLGKRFTRNNLELLSQVQSAYTGLRRSAKAIRGRGKVEPVFVPQVEQIAASLGGLLRPGDVIAMMGAGSISGVAHDLAAQLRTLAGQTPGEGA